MNILDKINSKLISFDDVAKVVSNWKKQNKKIVFTNGCFDILHIGHVTYLAQASEFGDKLIIGLNSDESVKMLKGEDRPINNQEDRGALLAALFFVDVICVFNEETPLNLIKKVNPDFLVKGGDYKISEIVGANYVETYGGTTKIIDLVPGKSSTNIIENM